VNAASFLRDLEAKPAALQRLADRLREDPWAIVPQMPGRVVFVGMGSSRFAAMVAAGRLRAAGIDAVAEYASARTGHAGGPGALAVGISASGRTPATVEALSRLRDAGATTVAVTNLPASPLAEAADAVVDLAAGVEEGGVACRTFQHTLAILLGLEARLLGRRDGGTSRFVALAAETTEDLLVRRGSWLPEAVDLLTTTGQAFVLAPNERLSSAEQGALMLREGPRLIADACETGDWLHVDVYLTKPLDYRALLFAGSRFDAEVMGWISERGSTVVAVGGDVDGARATIRYAHDDDEEVALLTEVLVAELIAAEVWAGRD
jgi:glutamine---fructose-6-phosphate transaminase (isomerizing)